MMLPPRAWMDSRQPSTAASVARKQVLPPGGRQDPCQRAALVGPFLSPANRRLLKGEPGSVRIAVPGGRTMALSDKGLQESAKGRKREIRKDRWGIQEP